MEFCVFFIFLSESIFIIGVRGRGVFTFRKFRVFVLYGRYISWAVGFIRSIWFFYFSRFRSVVLWFLLD